MTSLFRALKASLVDCLLLSQDGSFGINKHKRAREQQKAKSREACANPRKYNRSLIWNYQQLKNLSRSYTSYFLLHMCGTFSLITVSCLCFFACPDPLMDVNRGPGKRLKTLSDERREPDCWTLATTALRCVNEKAYFYIYKSSNMLFGRKPHSWY